MGGGGTQTSTQTTGATNPAVDKTVGKLLTGLQTQYDKGAAAGTPAATTQGWASQLSAAGNPDYARGINGATSEFADIAAGNRMGMNDPAYATLRAKAGDDTLRDVNSMFTSSGRFGSGSHVNNATDSLGKVYAGMDMAQLQNDQARQMSAAQMLPQMFAAGQAPGSVQAAVGGAQQQQPWQNLASASSILAGTAGSGSQTTSTTTPTAPWWQTGLSALGQFF